MNVARDEAANFRSTYGSPIPLKVSLRASNSSSAQKAIRIHYLQISCKGKNFLVLPQLVDKHSARCLDLNVDVWYM